jgi:hypothetical protein
LQPQSVGYSHEDMNLFLSYKQFEVYFHP